MSWDYRIVETEEGFEVREVYYYDDGTIKFYSQTPVEPFGVDFEEMTWDLSRMVEALGKPVLKETELEKATSEYRSRL